MKKITALIIFIVCFFGINSMNFAQQDGWFSINHGENYQRWSLYFINPTTGYVYSYNPNMYMTTTGGDNWFNIPNMMGAYKFLNPTTGYAIGYDSIYKSTNSGLNWSLVSYTYGLFAADIAFINQNTGYTVGNGNNYQTYPFMFKTTDGGLTWTGLIHDPPEFMNIRSIAFADSIHGTAIGYIGHTPYMHAIVFSTLNGGLNWSNGGAGAGYIYTGYYSGVQYVDNHNGFLANDLVVYRTSNSGLNWQVMQPIENVYSTFFVDSLTGYGIGRPYAVNHSIIYKTTDGAASWIGQDTCFTADYNGIFFANTLTGYAVGGGGVIVKTTTGGSTVSLSGQVRFQDNNQPVNTGYVKALHYDRITDRIITVDSAIIQSNGTYSLIHIPPQDSLYIMAFENDEAQLVYVPTYYPSTTNWQNATVLYPTGNLTNIDVLVYRINNTGGPYHIGGHVYTYSDNPFLGLNNAIVYAKAGSDYKSYSISNNAGLYRVDSLVSSNYTLSVDRIGYAPINRSVQISNYSKDTVDITFNLVGIVQKGKDIPKSYVLGNNYPNPFNPTTKISFGLPRSSNTKLIVYDLLGREVITLVNDKLEAGNYNVEWNAGNYSSGIYFYRIESGDFVQTKKMVLLK